MRRDEDGEVERERGRKTSNETTIKVFSINQANDLHRSRPLSLSTLPLQQQKKTKTEPAGSNDTSPIFNWHPLLMVAALAAWAEGALQFRSPLGTSCGLSPMPPRPARKAAHALLHALASVAAGAGLCAAWLSHSKKLPTAIPHFYSVHALLGLFAAVLLFSQFALGFAAFLWPRGAPAARDGFRKTHASLGALSLARGAGAAFAGLAEKAAFLVVGAKAQPRSSAVALPAAAAVFLAAGIGATLSHVLGPRGKPSLDGISSSSSSGLGGGGGGGGGGNGEPIDEF